MQAEDIDQIAENADNLINILQSIKQAKKLKDTSSDLLIQNVPAQIHAISPQQTQIQAEEVEVEQVTAPKDDFWDNHTHSPLVQKQKTTEPSIDKDNDDRDELELDQFNLNHKKAEQDEEDFWGDS